MRRAWHRSGHPTGGFRTPRWTAAVHRPVDGGPTARRSRRPRGADRLLPMTTTEVAPLPIRSGAAGPAISVRGLVKRYGDRAVVDGLDLEVARGECFALLGPNGAGKTTTIEVLEGVRRRDGGDVVVLGEDPASAGRAWRARIGVVSQGEGAAQALTVREAVDHFAAHH